MTMYDMLQFEIVKSRMTGKYHLAAINSNSLDCNYSGQARRPNVRKAQACEIVKANDESFCKKCFPNGKPV